MRDQASSGARSKISAIVTAVVHDNSGIDGHPRVDGASIGCAAVGSVGAKR